MWIDRTIESYFQEKDGILSYFPVWLVLGPRQIGKSSLLKHCSEKNRAYISFDDLEIRIKAKEDPVLFIKNLKFPLCIDEIQYAPEILSAIKLQVDKTNIPGLVWLTGSQNFEVMKGVQESLAGRVAILNLYGFTDSEKKINAQNPSDYFATIFQSNFPKLFNNQKNDIRSFYFSSYLQTYVERDIRELLGISKRREFEIFIKVCAHRSGQLLNYDDMARDVKVSPTTIKEWLSLLEDSFLIKLVHPWYSSRNKRLIKTPKLYFLDTGLCSYLMGWQTPEQMRLGPSAGALFETHVISNIYRELKHKLKTFELYFWRTKDQDEIDLILELNGTIFPIEIKLGNFKSSQLPKLAKCDFKNRQKGLVVSLIAKNNTEQINDEWDLVSPTHLVNEVLEKIKES